MENNATGYFSLLYSQAARRALFDEEELGARSPASAWAASSPVFSQNLAVPPAAAVPQAAAPVFAAAAPQQAQPASGAPMPSAAEDAAFEEFYANNPSAGELKMQVVTARGVFPVAGADVTVSKRIGDRTLVLYTLTTDKDGQTAVMRLPAPSASLSQQPGGKQPYETYDVRVDYPGYRSVKNLNLPIFSGVTSIQPVELVPITSGNSAPIIIYEREPGNL